MARDRKKAKARRARQERQQRSGGSSTPSRKSRPGEPGGDEPTGFDPLGPLGRKPGDMELAEEAEEGLPVDEVDTPPGDDDEKAVVYEDELSDDAAGHGVLAELVDRDQDLGIETEPDPELEQQAEEAAKATGRKPRREPKPQRSEGN